MLDYLSVICLNNLYSISNSEEIKTEPIQISWSTYVNGGKDQPKMCELYFVLKVIGEIVP